MAKNQGRPLTEDEKEQDRRMEEYGRWQDENVPDPQPSS